MINCTRNEIHFRNIFHIGSYTDSTGLRIVREHVAQFITKRDGYTADPDRIFLTSGGATAIKVGNSQLRPQATSRYPSKRRRLGAKRDLTSQLTLPRTNGNEAG